MAGCSTHACVQRLSFCKQLHFLAIRSWPDETASRFHAWLARTHDPARRYLPRWSGERVLETVSDRRRSQHQYVFDHLLHPDWLSWRARAHGSHRAADLSLDGVGRGFSFFQVLLRFQIGWLLLALCRCRLGLCSTHRLHPSASAMTTYQFFTTAWAWNSAVLILSALALIGYFLAFGRQGRPLYFAGAVVIFLLAFI